MPADRTAPRARLARRRFLGALAVAPAALAGCAGAAGAGPGAASPAGASPSGGPRRASAPDAATAAVREQPLAPAAEPAFVFRAAAARPGEP